MQGIEGIANFPGEAAFPLLTVLPFVLLYTRVEKYVVSGLDSGFGKQSTLVERCTSVVRHTGGWTWRMTRKGSRMDGDTQQPETFRASIVWPPAGRLNKRA